MEIHVELLSVCLRRASKARAQCHAHPSMHSRQAGRCCLPLAPDPCLPLAPDPCVPLAPDPCSCPRPCPCCTCPWPCCTCPPPLLPTAKPPPMPPGTCLLLGLVERSSAASGSSLQGTGGGRGGLANTRGTAGLGVAVEPRLGCAPALAVCLAGCRPPIAARQARSGRYRKSDSHCRHCTAPSPNPESLRRPQASSPEAPTV